MHISQCGSGWPQRGDGGVKCSAATPGGGAPSHHQSRAVLHAVTRERESVNVLSCSPPFRAGSRLAASTVDMDPEIDAGGGPLIAVGLSNPTVGILLLEQMRVWLPKQCRDSAAPTSWTCRTKPTSAAAKTGSQTHTRHRPTFYLRHERSRYAALTAACPDAAGGGGERGLLGLPAGIVWQDGAVTGHESDPATLSLHAARLLGFAETGTLARRFQQDRIEVEERLLDFEAIGWVSRSEFAGTKGWSLTPEGRVEGERRLAEELDASGARPVVVDVHVRFLPLNARFQEAVTRWQLRPFPGAPMAANDHTDHRWDDRVFGALGSVGRGLEPLTADLAAVLPRLRGYAERYESALSKALRGQHRWVDGVGLDSCHVVWMQFHEDLLATLGLDRSSET